MKYAEQQVSGRLFVSLPIESYGAMDNKRYIMIYIYIDASVGQQLNNFVSNGVL